MTRLAFYPVADSYLLAIVAALVLIGLLLLGPRGGRTTGRRRAVLAALRVAVIVLLVLAILRPTLVYTETKKQSATLVLLVDQSRSMSVPDAIGGKTRWQLLRETLADAQPALAKLAEDFELKPYGFDAQTRALSVSGGKVALGETPDGTQTALGAALEDVLRLEAGKRLLGVVLLSDGAQRAYAPRDVAPQTAAARLGHLGYPLFTVPFGQSRGLGQAQDVAVTELLVNPTVFVKNELAIGGQVRVDGYAGREVPVKVLFETAAGKMEVVASETLKATADGQLLPVKLSHAPPMPGEYKLTLEATRQPGELVTTNNQLSTFVNVLKGGLSVLYLEGSRRPEIKYLRWALGASPDIKVDYYHIDPRHPETRPGDMPQWFQPGKYDVYLLGDLDASVFRGTELKDLAGAVERGAGLMMLGGFHSFGPGGYASTPLRNVLPVQMDENERQRLDDPPRSDVQVPGPLQIRPTPVGPAQFIMNLSGNRQENEALWAKLPPLEGANRLGTPARGALVLAVAGRNTPMLIAHQYGNGRAMAFAADSTWRWWMHGFEAADKRFWRQCILWLARKDQAADGNVWVRLAKRRFAPTERVEFTVGATAATGEPVTDATFEAWIVPPGGPRRALTLVRQGDQTTGSFHDTQTAGDYAIEVTANQKGTALGSSRARFLVFEQDLELDHAAAQSDVLENLAAITGGESILPERLHDLIERLGQRIESLEIEQETRRTFWDTWPFFLVFVGLLAVEWYLRKRWGLV